MQNHRFGQRDQALQGRIGQDRIRVGQVPLQGDHARAGQQRAGVRDHHRILVDIGHPAVRVSGPGELVGVLRGGQPAAGVDELPDALPGQPGDGAGQEHPVLPGPHRQQREHLYEACRLGPVGGVVVLPAEQVVVHAGDIGPAGIDRGRLRYLQLARRRHAAWPGHHSSFVAGAAPPGVRAPGLDGFPLAGQPAERPASSASIALRWAKMGTQAAEPGRARARDVWRSRLVRASSAAVSPLTSWLRLGSGTGDSRTVFLLGKVGIGGLNGARSRRDLACLGLVRWGPVPGGHRVGKRRLRVGAVVH